MQGHFSKIKIYTVAGTPKLMQAIIADNGIPPSLNTKAVGPPQVFASVTYTKVDLFKKLKSFIKALRYSPL
jgi:hypothetical protein